ncbi:hypothetical protein [Litorisediminicola beolgyonensis]|uniref:Tip attachment protein J domain-containing protein n=1 Tax=Litorisediminicola beolgyonensis TaxID=1173614 RepID=A0ABW3ZID4_9RHOB
MISAIGTWFAAQTVVVQIGIRLAVGLAISLLTRPKIDRPKPPSIQTNFTTSGGTEPQKTIVGRFATHGHRVYRNSHGGSERVLYTRVVELGDLPGVTLRKVFIGGQDAQVDFGQSLEYGFAPAIAYEGTRKGPFGSQEPVTNAKVLFFNGAQTAASAYLVDQYGGRSNYVWTTDHVLTRIPYAIVVCRGNPKVFSGVPELRFELDGIPLYDPRSDDTAGGTGTQRWSDPSTWAQTDNPVVIVYNILRGIKLGDGRVWGGEAESDEDLPFDRWTAAMNVCDQLVGTANRKRYRAGIEISFTEAPAGYIEELLAACNGQIAELGGVFDIQVGAPEVPITAITDDDVLINRPQEFEPFPSFDAIYNGASVTHPSPAALWNGRELDPVLFPDLEADDGFQRLYDVQLSTVFNAPQARQVAKELVLDNRRHRQHVLSLPPDYVFLSPLRTISWTSDWNSYTDKAFEVGEITYDLRTLVVQVSLRERDPDDFIFDDTLVQLDPPQDPVVELLELVGLPGFQIAQTTVVDANGTSRRPAILLTWDGFDLVDVAVSANFELRLAATAERVLGRSSSELLEGQYVLDDVLPGEDYEVRARAVSTTIATSWGPWVPVTAPDIRFSIADLAQEVFDQAASDAQDLIDQYDLDVSIPRLDVQQVEQRSVTEAIERIEDAVVRGLARLSSTESLVRGAGIYVDPTEGTVRISAFETSQERATEAEVRLDAAEAAISLKASETFVYDQIAAAVLDPADLAALDDLQLRVQTVELDLAAAEASITSKAEVTEVDGLDVRLTTAEEDIDGLEAQITQKVDLTAFDPLETRVTSAEQTISALDGANITQVAADTRYASDELVIGEDARLGDLLQSYRNRKAIRADIAFAQTNLSAAVSDEREARASAETNLGARIDQTQAQIVTESKIRISAEDALAAQIDTLSAEIDDNRADIISEQQARASGDSANASAIDAVVASVDDLDAEVSVQATAVATLEGKAAASLVARVSAGGASGGYEFVAGDDPVNGPAVKALFTADQIGFLADLVQFFGTVKANQIEVTSLDAISANLGTIEVGSANIENLAVGTGQLALGAVTTIAASFVDTAKNVPNSGETTIGTITVSRAAGYETEVQFSCDINHPAMDQVNDHGEAQFLMKRGGTQLEAVNMTLLNLAPSGRNITFPGPFFFRHRDTDTSGGSATYEVTAQFPSGLRNGWSMNVNNRLMDVRQIKR